MTEAEQIDAATLRAQNSQLRRLVAELLQKNELLRQRLAFKSGAPWALGPSAESPSKARTP